MHGKTTATTKQNQAAKNASSAAESHPFVLNKSHHLILQKVDADPIRTCKNFRDDYLECLHHKKEVRDIFIPNRL